MLVIDSRFCGLYGETKTVSLPDDLMCTPIVSSIENVSICHSDSANKWYAIQNLEHPIDTKEGEIYSGLISVGSWADLADYVFDPYFAYAPFKWGNIYHSAIVPDGVQYMPIWENLETGKYDFEGLPIMRENYKLITIMPYHAPIEADNPIQYNFDSRFHVEDYGEDLIRLVRDLELYTKKTF